MFRVPRRVALVATLLLVMFAACGDDDDDDAAGTTADETLTISAIPDQDPAKLAAREELMAGYLADVLDTPVEYVPVSDYAASVALFKAGDLDVVFYGGLTGVQARLQVDGARLLAQRDIDAAFRSVFIAHASTGIEPISSVADLAVFAGRRFTFGSESSTSGRLMPQYFLDAAGVGAGDFGGEAGFSGSHDKTIDLVEAGSYEAGALNRQVWESRKEAGTVDLGKVVEVFVTPPYHDYHWIAGPTLDDRFGDGFTDRLADALLALDGSDADEQAVLDAYGAAALVETEAGNYDEIEAIGRKLDLITD